MVESSSLLHVKTAFLPVYFFIAAVFLHNFGRILCKPALKRVSYFLFLLTFLVTFLTCGLGGVIIRISESAPGTNLLHLKFHAWTSMIVFVISGILAYLSFKSIRNTHENRANDVKIIWYSVSFIAIYILTVFVAFRISS